MCVLDFDSAAATSASAAATPSIATAVPAAPSIATNGLFILASVAVAADSLSVNANGILRMPAVQRMAKSCSVKPVVEIILCPGLVNARAAVLHAAVNHPSLANVCELAIIDSSKDQAV